MINPFIWFSKRFLPYEPLVTIEISRSRLINNIKKFIKIAPKGQISPVLKSNAYGHGILEISKIIENEINKDEFLKRAIPFFTIDSYFEAMTLRAKNITTPLLIIGYTRPEIILSSRLSNLSYTITDIETLTKIHNTNRKILIHIKIDTGMNRQGIKLEQIDQVIELIKSNNKIILQGICSHLSDADGQNQEITENQIKLWNELVKKVNSLIPSIKYFHLSNTHGHLYSEKIEANLSRLGIGLYGIAHNLEDLIRLEPVMEMKTIITSIKKIKKGETVGYNNTFKAEKDMIIATIPVGYYEGIDRRLSNRGFVEIIPEKIPCPIIGRISMNITSIDISHIPNIEINSKVLVISNDSKSKCSIESIAKLCNTINYESVIRIPGQLKRIIVR